jgi:hypothetical protein
LRHAALGAAAAQNGDGIGGGGLGCLGRPLAAWSVLAALVLAASVVARAQKALRAAAATAF